MILALLLGCPSGDVPPADTHATVDTGTIGWWYDPPEDGVTAVWSQAEAEAEWQDVLDRPVPTCNDIIAAWLHIFSLEPGGSCLGADPGGLSDDRGCLLADGTWVRGQTDYRYTESAETSSFEHVVNLDADLVWPDGSAAAYQGACGVSGDDTKPGSLHSEAQGTYHDAMDTGFFLLGMEGMWTASIHSGEDGRDTLRLEGGISYEGDTFIYFDDFSVDDDNCALGGAHLRDPSGYWWVLQHGEEGSVACEPCGALSFAGVPVGESCLDWRVLVQQQADALWRQSPWVGE